MLILILQEVDLNARRTHRLNIAETITRKLEMKRCVWPRVSGISPGIQRLSGIQRLGTLKYGCFESGSGAATCEG
jgi:hypothetical protein